ncbi:MAG: RDD family protein [Hyphomicrobiales bacterium]|nr:RDD family protein [Hyphomicrobiales bacterium]
MSDPVRQITIRHLFDPSLEPDLFENILSRRAMAYVFDLVGVSILWLLAAVVVFFLGIATFGLAWLIYPALWPILGVLYTMATLGGPTSATPGMSAMGLSMRHTDGRRPDTLTALMHVVVFYALTVTLTPLVHLVGLFTERRQLLQDLAIGVVVMDARVLAFTGR